MNIPSFDWHVVQGNTGTVENPAGIVCQLDPAGGLAVAGAQLHFFAKWLNQTRLKISMGASGISLDPATGRITVPIAVDTFAGVQPYTHVSYELEYRRGAIQRAILSGSITLLPGISDD